MNDKTHKILYVKYSVDGDSKVDVPLNYMCRHFANHPEWMYNQEDVIIYQRDEED